MHMCCIHVADGFRHKNRRISAKKLMKAHSLTQERARTCATIGSRFPCWHTEKRRSGGTPEEEVQGRYEKKVFTTVCYNAFELRTGH